MLQTNWTNPFTDDMKDLGSLSTAVAAPVEITTDLLNVQSKGEDAYKAFQKERLSANPTKWFHDTLPRLKLKTFQNIKKSKTVQSVGKEVILKAERNLFGHMAVIAQTQ